MSRVVEAAGTVCWRRRRGNRIEVLLAHSARHRAWTWPKGKVEPGETLPECAVRETLEETGAVVVLGRPLPTVSYSLPDGRAKRVEYWAARAVAHRRASAPSSEIDATRWVAADRAAALLNHRTDRAPLAALLQMAEADELDTVPLLVLRHARARPRDSWSRPDADRPLLAAGRRQAAALANLLACWRPRRVISSPWRRCRDTIAPYLAAHGGSRSVTGAALVKVKRGLSEAGHRRSPSKAPRQVARLLRRGEPALLCTHRPLLDGVLGVIRRAAAPPARRQVPAADPFLAPAEVLVAHVARHPAGRVVACERWRPR